MADFRYGGVVHSWHVSNFINFIFQTCIHAPFIRTLFIMHFHLFQKLKKYIFQKTKKVYIYQKSKKIKKFKNKKNKNIILYPFEFLYSDHINSYLGYKLCLSSSRLVNFYHHIYLCVIMSGGV